MTFTKADRSAGRRPSYSAGDVFSVRYDGQWVRYYRNGVAFREKFAPGLTLFLDSSFYTPGSIATDVDFGPLTSATPSKFIARGTAKSATRTVIKNGGSKRLGFGLLFDPGLSGLPRFVQGESDERESDGRSESVDPTTDADWTSLDAAFYVQPRACGTFEKAATYSAAAPTRRRRRFGITYDGSNVRYYVDGALVRTTAVAGLTLFMDSSFYTTWRRHQLARLRADDDARGRGYDSARH
jgi:hypothetical protein